MSPISVTLLTGFLGAGKTTLLNQILRDPEFAGTAVLINEFGEIAIDHDLVSSFSKDLVTTKTGCLCCATSSDITNSLHELWVRRSKGEIIPFTRVLVETTGLVDPVPVVHALLKADPVGEADRLVLTQFALARVVTLFDAINGGATLDNHLEALKQVALADVIVISKADLLHDPASIRDLDRARQDLTAINPSARLVERHSDWPELRRLLNEPGTYDLRTKGEDAVAWLRAEPVVSSAHEHLPGSHTSHHGNIRSHVITIDEPIRPVVFRFFLKALKLSAGPKLLRVKGLFALTDDPDRPVVVHGVQQLLHPIDRLDDWPTQDRRTRIVMIGHELNVDAMRSVLTNEKPDWLAFALPVAGITAALMLVIAASALGQRFIGS